MQVVKEQNLKKFNVPYYDKDNDREINASGNYNSGAMDFRNIGGKNYCAYELSSFYAAVPIIRVYSAETKKLVYSPKDVKSYAAKDDVKEPFSDLVSTTAALRLAAADDGMYVYHINNACSAIEAFHCPLK